MEESDAGKGQDLVLLAAGGGGAAVPLATGPEVESCGVFSPDGSLLALLAAPGGQRELYLAPVSWDGERPRLASGRVRLSRSGARSPRWAPDGRRIFFLSGSGTVQAVELAGRLEPSPPRTLFELPLRVEYLEVAAKGDRLLLTTSRPEDTALAIDVWVGWRPPR